MKKAKRILAAVVSCTLALSCSVSVLAETEETENTADSGYISVIPDTSTSGSSLYTTEEETTEITSTSNNGSSETAEEETTEAASETAESITEAVTETAAETEETGGSGGNISLLALSLSADTAEVGDFSVTGDTDGYSYEDNVLTISGGGEYLIAMADGVSNTEADRIEITSADEVTITIENINITSSSTSPFNINAEGDVNLILSGNNYLTSTNTYCAGLQKDGTTNMLTISSESGVDEDDTLEAAGGIYAAGIGGSYWPRGANNYGSGKGCNITINSGSVTAIGGYNGGAGIGGGRKEGSSSTAVSGSDIVINGGIITANGGRQGGAGIGGGLGADGSDITINGGNVKATGGSEGGAGIGGGYSHGGSNITINGGNVTAAGSSMGGAGIGGGRSGSGSDITINSGTVTVTNNESGGAGIGGGIYGSGSNITINNGSVTIVITGGSGACIGGGQEGNCDNITITGGYILMSLTGSVGNANIRDYICGGSSGTTGTITITGGFFGLGVSGDGELSITKTVDKSVARPGDTLTYEITVSGTSTDRNTVYYVEPADSYVVKYTTDAEISGTYPYMVVKGVAGGFSNIYVVDELPSGLTFVSASDDGDYSDVDNKVTWVIDTLNSGDSKVLTLVSTVN